MAFLAIAVLTLSSCCCCPTSSQSEQPVYVGQAYYFVGKGRGDSRPGSSSQSHGDDKSKTPSGESPPGGGSTGTGPSGTTALHIVPAEAPLPVPPVIQEGDYSCWSTCAEMIMRFHGVTTARQCAQAQHVFGSASIACCDSAGNLMNTPDCDNPSSPEFLYWGFYSDHEPPTGPPPFGTPMAYIDIKTEIMSGRPICYSSIENPIGGATPDPLQPGHMMVIVGYDDATMTIKVLDPVRHTTPDEYWIPFDDYYGTTGVYTHREVYSDIHPLP